MGSGTVPPFSLNLATRCVFQCRGLEIAGSMFDHSIALESRAKIGPGRSSEGGQLHPGDSGHAWCGRRPSVRRLLPPLTPHGPGD